MKEENDNGKEKKVLLVEDKTENSVFYPHEGGGEFLPIGPDTLKNNAALAE